MKNRLPSLVWQALFLFLLAGFIATSGFGQNSPTADPTTDLQVTPQAGPWMIIVSSFTGQESGKYAHDLCLEIRNNYKMPAYTFNWGAEKRRQRDEELRQKREAQLKWFQEKGHTPDQLRRKTVRIEDEYAVLVGGFRDMDAARKELDRIKKLAKPTSVPKAILTTFGGDDDGKKKDANTEVNPFQQSFVVRNPAVKFEQEPEKPDLFLKELNAHETYSLLQVKKPWTLAVTDFQGRTVIQPQSAPTKLLEGLLGSKKGSMLDAGAKQAHEVAKVLREKMQIEAYVLHMRWGSVVTVGSYDSQDDARLLQYQQALKGKQMGPAVQFFANPLPMKVPQL